MDFEEAVKSFRLRSDAAGPRTCVLAAARAARRGQLLWRWTWAAAAAVFAVCVPWNVALESPSPTRADLKVERAVGEITRALRDGEFAPRFRLALTPPRGSRMMNEVPR